MIKNPPQNPKQNGAPRPSGPRPSAPNPRGGRRRAPNQRRGGAGPNLGVAAAYSSSQRSEPPKITASRDECRIVHRELVASIVGSAGFAVPFALPVNPGISAVFNWLSVMAIGWEKYKFNRLSFKYYTRTGSGTPGSMMLAPDYDAADSAPNSEVIASAYEGVAEDAPWKDISCDMKKLGGVRYIRSGPLGPNLDIKTYDVAQLFACTVDGTAIPWGKLWVEYDVTFSVPQLPPSGGALLSSMIAQTPNGDTDAGPFSGGFNYVAGSDTGIASFQADGAITFTKVGRFAIVAAFGTFEGVADIDSSILVTPGAVILSEDTVGETTTSTMNHAIVSITAVGAKVTFSVSYSVSAQTAVTVLGIYQIPTTQTPFTIAP